MAANPAHKTYLDWAVARFNAGQSHASLPAFREHLGALGADPREPATHGWPCAEAAPAPRPVLFFEDFEYVDVGPLLTRHAAANGVPIQALIGLIHAECAFNTHAVRRGAWPDVSAGYSQCTVQTAASYGIGDGTNSDLNVETTLARLQDRETGVSVAARHYAMCLGVVDGMQPRPTGDERLIYAMRAYNGGTGYGLTEHYAVKYASHIVAYRQALDLAYQVLRGKNYPADPV